MRQLLLLLFSTAPQLLFRRSACLSGLRPQHVDAIIFTRQIGIQKLLHKHRHTHVNDQTSCKVCTQWAKCVWGGGGGAKDLLYMRKSVHSNGERLTSRSDITRSCTKELHKEQGGAKTYAKMLCTRGEGDACVVGRGRG